VIDELLSQVIKCVQRTLLERSSTGEIITYTGTGTCRHFLLGECKSIAAVLVGNVPVKFMAKSEPSTYGGLGSTLVSLAKTPGPGQRIAIVVA
jgi:hypothetical protein